MNTFDKKWKMNNLTSGKTVLAILGVMLSLPQESKASDNFFGRFFGNWQFTQQAGANAQQSAQAAEREKAAIKAAAEKAEAEKQEAAKKEAERQAKEKAIADRIAFEKEAAQKRMAQMEEDQRRAREHQQQKQHHVPQPVQASPQTRTHHDGKSFASSLMSGVIEAAKSTNPHDIPGFQTDKPKEALLNAETLGDAALAEARNNETSQHLRVLAKDRKIFKIDPDTDPLFVEANQVVADPQKAIDEEIVEFSDPDEDAAEETRTCIEGGDEYSQSCSKKLRIVLKITPASSVKKTHCAGHRESRAGGTKHVLRHYNGCGCGSYLVTVPKKVEILSEQWIDGCTILEDLTEKGLCRYVSKTTSPHNETRNIQGEPVTRDHFEEHFVYGCFKTPSIANSCTGLREKGCYQINSVCKEKAGDVCVLWEQTYSCPTGKRSARHVVGINKGSPFCLTGNCADTSYEANNEMMNAMSHLYALREAQNDLRDFKIIFKGSHRWCTRNCLGFRDCCGGSLGWGVTLHLSDCDKAEIELRTLRDKKLCVQVGTYCAERDAVFNSCIRKKTSFCCYGTKMARLIQENGRAQLGLGWGNVESPDCNGLSPEQLSRIDFSKINFSEIFADIQNKTVVKDQKQSLAQVSAERLQENMTLLTKPRIDQKQLATKHLDAKPLDEKSAQDLQKLKEKGL